LLGVELTNLKIKFLIYRLVGNFQPLDLLSSINCWLITEGLDQICDLGFCVCLFFAWVSIRSIVSSHSLFLFPMLLKCMLLLVTRFGFENLCNLTICVYRGLSLKFWLFWTLFQCLSCRGFFDNGNEFFQWSSKATSHAISLAIFQVFSGKLSVQFACATLPFCFWFLYNSVQKLIFSIHFWYILISIDKAIWSWHVIVWNHLFADEWLTCAWQIPLFACIRWSADSNPSLESRSIK